MKSTSKYYHFLLILILLGLNFQGLAQSELNKEQVYRVTAFQKGNPHVQSVSNEVLVQPSLKFYIPNAFTPNGDGLNDTFGVIGEGVIDYNIQIYDRWGKLIFQSNGSNAEWDGTFENKVVPTGVYVYQISGTGQSKDGKYKEFINQSGSITVVL